jgi:transposase
LSIDQVRIQGHLRRIAVLKIKAEALRADPARKERNTVERYFGKLGQFRAVATHCDRRECICQGTIDLASIIVWLRNPVP